MWGERKFRKNSEFQMGFEPTTFRTLFGCSKGRYAFSWEEGGRRAGASEGRVTVKVSTKRGGAIPHVSYAREGHTSFPEFFNENFCDVAFHFSYRLRFSFHLL